MSDQNNIVGPGLFQSPIFKDPPPTVTFDKNFETSKQTEKIDEAFAKAQSKFLNAVHDKKGARNNSYATIGSMLSACRHALGEEKIHVMQFVVTESDRMVRVITRLSHAGQFYQAVAVMPVAQPNNPQSHGSSYTYLRRYALIAMLGLVDAETDDDGAGGPLKHEDPIGTAKEPAKPEKKADWEYAKKEVKNYAPTTRGISPMQQVSAAISRHGRDRDLVGRWIRRVYPTINLATMSQNLADIVIQKIVDTPDEGFDLELKDQG